MRKRVASACALACAFALALGVPVGAFATNGTWDGPTTANTWTVPGADSDNTTVTSTNATPSYTVTVPTAVKYDKTNGNTITANVKGEIAAGYTVLVQAIKDNSADDPASDFTVLTLKDADSKEMELNITGTNQISWSRDEVEKGLSGTSGAVGTDKTVASLASGQTQKVGTYTGKIYYRVKYAQAQEALSATLDKTAVTLAPNGAVTLTPTAAGGSGTYDYSWVSDDASKVTVDEGGVVTNVALAAGDLPVTITCTATDSAGATATANCFIFSQLSVSINPPEATLVDGEYVLYAMATGGSGTYDYSWVSSDEEKAVVGWGGECSSARVQDRGLSLSDSVTITCTVTDGTTGATATANCIITSGTSSP